MTRTEINNLNAEMKRKVSTSISVITQKTLNCKWSINDLKMRHGSSEDPRPLRNPLNYLHQDRITHTQINKSKVPQSRVTNFIVDIVLKIRYIWVIVTYLFSR